MQPISSGTTTERIVRAALLVVLVSVFAIAYLWDGHVRYVRENAGQLAVSLGLPSDSPYVIDQKLTAAEARAAIGELSVGTAAGAVTRRLDKPGIEHGNDWYYLGPGGHLRVGIEHGRVARIEWTPGRHTETDLAWQRRIGYFLLVLGVGALARLLRALMTRVSVSPEGLKVGGKPPIPFSAITGLRSVESDKGRSVRIEYSLDAGKGAVTLDEYVLREFIPLVAAICRQTGFPDPFRPDEDGGDAEQADGAQLQDRHPG